MNVKYQKPRGTIDLYDDSLRYREELIKILEKIAQTFCYQKVVTPIFETKNVFVRSLGSSSDLVNKEFFELVPKNNKDYYVLRPENTASIIRMVVEEKLIYKKKLPLKFYYHGSMFRYERPQNGRLREFYQFGLELIGSNHLHDDLDIILLTQQIIFELKLENFVTLKINYLGNLETKVKWSKLLKTHFQKHIKKLSPLNKMRIEKNPIRILDDKNDQNLDCVKNAPKINSCIDLNETKKQNYIFNQLDALKIKYEYNSNLVRGFDYYTGLVFEYVFNHNSLVGQNTLIGGGRYNNLLSEFGIEDKGCIGFGLGVDRILIALKAIGYQFNNKKIIDVYLACLVTEIDYKILKLISFLRNNHISVEINWNIIKLEKHFKIFDLYHKPLMLIYGKNEQEKNIIVLKNKQEQINFNLTEFNEILMKIQIWKRK